MSGGLESTRENHTSRLGRVSPNPVTGNVRKPTKIMFRVFCTSNSSPILLFCPLEPQLIFCKIQTNVRRTKSRCMSSFVWCRMVPFCDNSDLSSRHQKRIIRVRSFVFCQCRDSSTYAHRKTSCTFHTRTTYL